MRFSAKNWTLDATRAWGYLPSILSRIIAGGLLPVVFPLLYLKGYPMKAFLRSLALLSLLSLLTACITEDQQPAQEMVSRPADDQASALPPEAISDLASESVTNKVIADKKREPELTPDDIEADNDPMKVGFETAKWNLSETAMSRIQNVAEQLKVDDELKLKIDGHCDERGTDAYNQVLSEKRALAVRNTLVKMGIDKKRLTVEGFGRKRTLVKGHSEKVYSHNRRVEMIFSK